jgi:hypothetical protein
MVIKIHKSNLEGKINGDYHSIGGEVQRFFANEYVPFERKMDGLKGITHTKTEERVRDFNEYYEKARAFAERYNITPQSKFLPTAIEEFTGYLLRDIPFIRKLGLGFFRNRIFAGLKIKPDGSLELQTKDVDIGIAKEFEVKINDKRTGLIIPVIAIECKTYVDNTMFSEAQFTAQKLKSGTPAVKALIVTFSNEVDEKKLPSVSPIDEIYVLTTDGITVDEDTTCNFVKDVKRYLGKASTELSIKIPGKLLHPYE